MNALTFGSLFLFLLSFHTATSVLAKEDKNVVGVSELKLQKRRTWPVAERQAQVQQAMGIIPLSFAKASSTGHVAILRGNIKGYVVGYLNEHKVVPTLQEAALYTYTTTPGAPSEIHVAGSDLRLCAVSGLYGTNLGRGLKNFHLSRHTPRSTVVNSGPLYDPKHQVQYETTIFAIDPDTSEIAVRWINTGDELVGVQVVLMGERTYYVGDYEAFRQYANQRCERVVYKWIPAKD